MKAAYSAKELAKMELSVLPGTAGSITRRAGQEEWPFFWQAVRGGQRMMYRAHLLPDYVRQAIVDKEKIDSLVDTKPSLPGIPQISKNQAQKALLKADLLRLYLEAMAAAAWGQKDQARTDFMAAYNSGLAYPEIYKELGELPSWKTLEGWKAKLKKNNGDTLRLADRRGYGKKGKTGLNKTQTDILLRCALHPNKPRISEAIRMAHAVMKAKNVSNGHSEASYRRWLNDWASRNHHVWTFNREGAKAWNDKCAYYIQRDYDLINVGDVIVADGHVLNFEILNPWTGKPKRMTLICFLDMKSGVPLGWEIMPTEDTSAISSALRRAILRLGRMPQVVYLDNGKAFKSRFFQGCANFEEAGFAGLYERLGIKAIFAWPYHGQSKTVERFFGSFAELERWCPTYTGTSIEHKPPRMNRGERLHRKVHEKATGGHVLTMEQAHRAIAAWFDTYTQRPQRGHLNGQAPMELFLEGKGPGVDPAELTYLMMSLEVRHINRNGISFQGRNYYAPALYGRRHPVTIRYDLQDLSTLYVFEQDGSFLCEAGLVEGVHPAATVLGSEEDKEKLRHHIELKRRQEKEASASARAMLENEIIPTHQRQLANIGILPDGHQRAEIKQLPRNPVKLTDADRKQALEEADKAQRYHRDQEAALLAAELEELSEFDRYDRLLEMEMRGDEFNREQRRFMRVYEQTGEYERDSEYWDSRRAALAVMYGQKEMAAGGAAAEV